MKKFIKNHVINIVFGIIAIVLIVLTLMSAADWILDPVFWSIVCIMIAVALVYKQSSVMKEINNNFKFFTRFKVMLIITLLIIIGILWVLLINAQSWDGLTYALLRLFAIGILVAILIVNLIMKIYYKIKRKK